MGEAAPILTRMPGLFCRVEGRFYRGVDPDYRSFALAGSRSAGRYSRADQPTLYLSSSPKGVEAALVAHRRSQPEIVALDVAAELIFDMRDAGALEMAGLAIADAVAPWPELVAKGGTPLSWRFRERVAALGGAGLIDPSRRAPGLWHLVLFAWNSAGAPRVSLSL